MRFSVKRIAAAGIIALLLFTVTGFFILPPILKAVLTTKLSEQLHRPVAIAEIRINPFMLTVAVKRVSVGDRAGDANFLSFDELFLNLQGSSVIKRGLVLRELRLANPRVNLVRNEDGSWNFSDLIPVTKDKREAEKPDSQPRFSVSNIQISGGAVDFRDEAKKTSHAVRNMVIAVPVVANLPGLVDTFVQPLFEADINDMHVRFEGKTKPFHNSLETLVDIDIKDLNVPHYLAYAPIPLSVTLSSCRLDLRAAVSYIQYADRAPSLTVSGETALREIILADKAGKQLFRAPQLSVIIDPSDLMAKQVRLKETVLTDAEAGIAAIPKLAVRNAHIDAAARKILISEIETEKGNLQIIRQKDGTLNLANLLPAGMKDARKSDSSATDTKDAEANPWHVAVQKFSLSGFSVRAEDRVPPSPVKVAMDNVHCRAEDISTEEGSAGKLLLSFDLDRTGRVSIEGPFSIAPLKAQMALNLKGIRLAAFQPYLEERLNIILKSGALAAKGSVLVAAASQPPQVTYDGTLTVSGFSSVDKKQAEDFLKWKSLHFAGIRAVSRPLSLRIKEVALADFYSRIIVHPDGTLNMQQILAQESADGVPEGTTDTTEQPAKVPDTLEKPKPETTKAETQRPDPARIVIDAVTLQGGTINFSDNYIRPNYTMNMQEVGGRVSGLSSAQDTTADVDLRGKLNNYAPLRITGKINPLREDFFVDLKFDFKDMDLSPVTPYSGKYLGYTIQKGKLSFSLQYLIAKRQLDAKNEVFLDQLTLGDQVDSPDATKLPVRLAIALLKNRNGEIKLDIPVSGSLDDPEFSLGRIILKILVNLLVKAATSPFALLGAIFGGGEELSYLEFDYGMAYIDEPSVKKLDTLIKALHDRPALKIELQGHADVEKDREGLRQRFFDRKVKAQKLKEMAKGGETTLSVDDVQITKEEYPRYLKMAYKAEKFPKPRNIIGMAKDLPVPEMEKLMLTHIEVKDDDLRLLAAERAMAVKDYLLKSNQVEQERVFLVEPKAIAPEKKEKQKDSRVDFSLK